MKKKTHDSIFVLCCTEHGGRYEKEPEVLYTFSFSQCYGENAWLINHFQHSHEKEKQAQYNQKDKKFSQITINNMC